MNFKKTPSFYESNEQFNKYLGQTSYYLMLQYCIKKFAKLANPKSILELGYGNGNTSIEVAKILTNTKIKAIDFRDEMKEIATLNAKNNIIENIEWIVSDMVEYIKSAEELPEFIFALYSFHHIIDPLENKIEFLKHCKDNMPKGGYLCIGETFLPKALNENERKEKIKKMYELRSIEANISTFWAVLKGLEKSDIELAENIAKYAEDNEIRAGQLVVNRDNEYLVEMGWLTSEAKNIGFKVLLDGHCNGIGDGVVLLQKEN